MAGDTRILLSVDFDFFVREKHIWDWSHAESKMYQEVLWPHRASTFLAQGIDLRKETDPGKYAEPTPDRFWSVLERLGYDTEDVVSCVTNSHTFAAPHWVHHGYFPEDDYLLINFDAHHDLGYRSAEEMEKVWESGRVMCGDWLYTLMRAVPNLKAKIVYPSWRGLEEIEKVEKRPEELYPFLEGRVEYGVFSEDFVRLPEDAFVEDAFICRSGAWVPPWLDQLFTDFCYSGGFGELFAAFEDEEGSCALDPRKFSWADVEAYAEQLKAFYTGDLERFQEEARLNSLKQD